MGWHVWWHMVTARQRVGPSGPCPGGGGPPRVCQRTPPTHQTLKEPTLITLGLILLILGLVLSIGILTTIGGILLVVGLILLLIGRTSPVGGRAHWY